MAQMPTGVSAIQIAQGLFYVPHNLLSRIFNSLALYPFVQRWIKAIFEFLALCGFRIGPVMHSLIGSVRSTHVYFQTLKRIILRH